MIEEEIWKCLGCAYVYNTLERSIRLMNTQKQDEISLRDWGLANSRLVNGISTTLA